ncbi:helicase-associated domain-containing protein [Paenibacillus sp. BR2-3]|uniref:helicase-associated domain-containing protein n=1 Tax=Paenibacillus sp. BR2-3 TaxID=3048494 RepID=UPI0039773849
MIHLTAPAQELIKRICAAYASQPFEEGKVKQFRPANLCPAEQKLALIELRRVGMLSALQKIWGEKLYYIPAERLPQIQRHCFPFTPATEENSNIYTAMEEASGLAGDLFQALLFVAEEGLPVTVKGSIHKKHISRLASRLSLQEKHLRGLALNYPYSEIYPLPAAVMVDLMLCLGLLKRNDSAYILDKEILESWLHLPESDMTSLLYTAVINRYGSSEPAGQHFRCLIARPDFVLKEWVSVSQILDWMEASSLVVPAHRSGLEASSRAWLECLAGFGWCQVGTDNKGSIYFRWIKLPTKAEFLRPSENGSSSAMLIVQTDFEVLVPPDVPFIVRWTLASCAELLSVEIMWSFRLTRERLEFANERGMPPDEVIAWLHMHTIGGLPEQVRLVLEQWREGIGRTSLADILLLSCRNEEDGDAIASHPRLQGHLTRLGPLHFVVPKEQEKNVRTELAAAGLAPHRDVQGREEEKTETVPAFHRKKAEQPGEYILPAPRPEQGLIHTGASQHYLQPAPLDPEETLLPGEESIPSMWSREWHCYHSTTAQKVMEQALKWGVKVRISLEDESCEFIPSRVLGNPWRMAGHLLRSKEGSAEEMELAAGAWKEMQMIIPGRR